MNALFSSSKPAHKTEFSIDSIKIYIGEEELRKFKTLAFNYSDRYDAVDAIKTLWEYSDVRRMYGDEKGFDRLYLTLTIRTIVDKTLILKRKVQPFENIKKIAISKPADKDYIWSLQINTDVNASQALAENSEALESRIRKIFEGRQNNIEEFDMIEDDAKMEITRVRMPFFLITKTFNFMIENAKKQLKSSKSTDMEKSLKFGRLLKFDEVAKIFAETEFQLSQNHITYYKVGEEDLNQNRISLMGIKAEKSDLFVNEKHVFSIFLTDSPSLKIKCKSQKEMDEWITTINNQTKLTQENHTVGQKDHDINNLEYRFESQINEKLENLIKPHDIYNFSDPKDLKNFKKIMSKQPCRSLLFKVLAEKSNYFSGNEKVLDIIFVLKDEQVKSKWLLWLESLHMLIVNSVRDKKLHANNFGKANLDLSNCQSTIEDFKANYVEISCVPTDSLKNKIMANIEAILDTLLESFRSKYFNLLKTDTVFQMQLLDTMKAPFFQANQFKKSSQFDKRDKGLVHSKSSTL